MLKAVPKSWASWDFIVLDGSQTVATLDMSFWREKGGFTVEDVAYEVYREGLVGGGFILEKAGTILARAKKPSVFRRTFEITHEGRHYTLCAKSAFRQTFLLQRGAQTIGEIAPDGIFTRRASVNFPKDLPLPVQIFIIWLAVLLWKRATNAAASS